MKVDGTRSDAPGTGETGSAAQSAQATDRLQQQRLDQQPRADETRNDRVELSADARLAESAVRAASKVSEIRPDVVERARAKLAAGELGADVLQLADRMIDSLLNR
jgi:hypothetical protein